MSGTFLQIVAVAYVLFLLCDIAVYSAVIVLRFTEPEVARPYRSFGFPFTTGIVLLGCMFLWVAAVLEDHRSGYFAAILLAVSIPVYAWLARRRRNGEAAPAVVPPT
jgi:APA family basic amino acid/polyamine antiporter